MSNDARWFDALGACRRCGKPATGVLRGPKNQSFGPYCRCCAESRIRSAERDRGSALVAAAAASWAAQPPAGASDEPTLESDASGGANR
jgi:hypothetical protein